MKKKLLILLIMMLLLCSCSSKEIRREIAKDEIALLVENKLSSMTLDEKIGQMLIIKYPGKVVDENFKKMLDDIKPGGFIIFGNNISTFDKTKKFISDLKKSSDIPMIVSLDEEGGIVQKIQLIEDTEILSIPSMEDVGKKGDENVAYEIGTVIAKELKTLGVNLTYAPVVDINYNGNSFIGTRSFGSNPYLVSKLALKVSKGIEDEGIGTCFKHFPGHGATKTDSHETLPVINKTYEEIKKDDLIPYIDAINENAKMIMVGHISFPNITGDNTPASLSKKIITNILLNDLNYKGLVITDALDMGALTNYYSDEEIISMALDAGVDLLLMPEDIYGAKEYIKENISEERINASVSKILTYKYKYLKDYDLLDKSYLNNSEEQNIINKIYK